MKMGLFREFGVMAFVFVLGLGVGRDLGMQEVRTVQPTVEAQIIGDMRLIRAQGELLVCGIAESEQAGAVWKSASGNALGKIN